MLPKSYLRLRHGGASEFFEHMTIHSDQICYTFKGSTSVKKVRIRRQPRRAAISGQFSTAAKASATTALFSGEFLLSLQRLWRAKDIRPFAEAQIGADHD
jgi:hypothetical protein